MTLKIIITAEFALKYTNSDELTFNLQNDLLLLAKVTENIGFNISLTNWTSTACPHDPFQPVAWSSIIIEFMFMIIDGIDGIDDW